MGSWQLPSIAFSLPDWVCRSLPEPGHCFVSDEEKMGLAIELSRLNVLHATGGPFGAVIFEATSGRLVAPGVNLVQYLGWAGAHAEMVAIAIADKRLGKFDLGDNPEIGYELFSSTEPCSMCMGCVTWSGLRRLVCGASDQDARAIGFDEGVKANDWVAQLRSRGIAVQQNVCREQAVSVLNAYKDQGGLIYNGRASTASGGAAS
jgi:tRNA(Arg) A34 adenosine deaminase TadA